MKISTKGRYGLRVLVYLAQVENKRRVPLREISVKQNITIKYLEQIMKPLLKAGYVESHRGNNGGYTLKIKAEELTLANILITMEGSLAPVACLEADAKSCDRYDDCETVAVWKAFDELIHDFFDGITLAKLASGEIESCNLTKR